MVVVLVAVGWQWEGGGCQGGRPLVLSDGVLLRQLQERGLVEGLHGWLEALQAVKTLERGRHVLHALHVHGGPASLQRLKGTTFVTVSRDRGSAVVSVVVSNR